MRGRFATAGLK